MITFQEIVDKKPHLRDALGVYEKVLAFQQSASELIGNASFDHENVAYPAGIVDPLFDVFKSIFGIPEDVLDQFKEMMKLGRIDFTRLPLNEIPSFSLPFHEDEAATLLFLLSKPYFLWLGDSTKVDASSLWPEGKCPLCNSSPSMSSIKTEEGKTLYCSFCEIRGHWHRIGCPHCQNKDGNKLDIITAEEEKGFSAVLCNECKSYTKAADGDFLNDYSPELLDIISLPLDVIAQEKGYRRLSPNPIGLTRMV